MPHAEPSKGKSRTALATAPRCLHTWSSQQWLRSGTGSTRAPAAPDPNTHTGTQTITAGFVISPVTDHETPHAVAHSVPSVSALRHTRPPRTQAAVSEQPILTMKVHKLGFARIRAQRKGQQLRPAKHNQVWHQEQPREGHCLSSDACPQSETCSLPRPQHRIGAQVIPLEAGHNMATSHFARVAGNNILQQPRDLTNAAGTGGSGHLSRYALDQGKHRFATCHPPYHQMPLSIVPNRPFFCKLGLMYTKQRHGLSNRAVPCTARMGAESWIPRTGGSPSAGC